MDNKNESVQRVLDRKRLKQRFAPEAPLDNAVSRSQEFIWGHAVANLKKRLCSHVHTQWPQYKIGNDDNFRFFARF